MEIIITEHAKERMVLRKITEKMIKEVLTDPDNKTIGYQNRFLFFKSFRSGIIKAVCVKEKKFYIIISVIWEKRKIK